MKRSLIGVSLLGIGAATFLTACSSNKTSNVSPTTNWEYNDKNLGGFDVPTDYHGQDAPGPHVVFVEGGRFTMGQTEDDLPTLDGNNKPRIVSVSSFYMDETEVPNISYREYVYWLQRAYGSDYADVISSALPDTTCWRRELAYNEPLVQYYFRHAAYNNYPVVGVNWNQARAFCKWRSDRVNEKILIERGILKKNPNQSNEDVFTTESYISGQYEGTSGPHKQRDLDPNGAGKRISNYGDGYLQPDFRLPTEAEWEYAAVGNIENNPEPETKRRRGEEFITDRNSYPWSAKNSTRYGLRNEYQGEFLGNFQRGEGDVMGMAGGLNDNADIPAPVYSYQPNAFGLYNMAGNVSEWVLDTYRPTTEEYSDFRPFRGNDYKVYKHQDDGTLEEKDSLGNLTKVQETPDELLATGHYETKTADVRNYEDGDTASNYSYNYGNSSLINDDAKVIKGGSWADRAYWMSPGTRRFMQASKGSATVGFRCVLDRLGSPSGNNEEPAGNKFGKQK